MGVNRELRPVRNLAYAFAAFGVCAAIILVAPDYQSPSLHIAFDGSIFVLTGVLALLMFDMGWRVRDDLTQLQLGTLDTARRVLAQRELNQMNDALEARVRARGMDLITANTALHAEGDARALADAKTQAQLRRLRLLHQTTHALEFEGHAVTSAHGGQAGIDMFNAASDGNAPFVAVITDLGMPHVDGRQVASAIKVRSRETRVVMLTGWGQRLSASGELPAHVDAVLSKPPNMWELRDALSLPAGDGGKSAALSRVAPTP